MVSQNPMSATFFFRPDESKSTSATSFIQVTPSGTLGFTLLQTGVIRR